MVSTTQLHSVGRKCAAQLSYTFVFFGTFTKLLRMTFSVFRGGNSETVVEEKETTNQRDVLINF